MSKPFPKNSFLQGNFAPVMAECDAPELIIEGELPNDMAGVLYRNGPNPMYPPLGNDHHWFLGEGMVHAIRVEDGKASYKNRWVRTDQYVAQREAGQRLVGTGFQDPGVAGAENIKRNVANTNIVWHGGKLYAIDEGNSPVLMDGDTLETQGSYTFEGKYEYPFTAHPKIDPQTGEMLFFGYMATGPGTPDISYGVVDADGNVTRSEVFTAPYASMVHDFITTDEHVIFPIFPATIDVERITKGGPTIAWDPQVSTMIGIMGRNDSTETIRWFEGEPCYVYHPMNAYTIHENGKTKVIADLAKYSRVPLFPDADGSRPPADLSTEQAKIVRWTFDLSSNTSDYTEEVLSDVPGEFPRLDERFAGLKYTQGFYATIKREEEKGNSADTIVHLDLNSGQTKEWQPGVGHSVIEPVFVPRNQSAEEGDGYVVTLDYNAEDNLSDFVVLDTNDISKGPIARVKLPTRVPFGFHGNWRSLN